MQFPVLISGGISRPARRWFFVPAAGPVAMITAVAISGGMHFQGPMEPSQESTTRRHALCRDGGGSHSDLRRGPCGSRATGAGAAASTCRLHAVQEQRRSSKQLRSSSAFRRLAARTPTPGHAPLTCPQLLSARLRRLLATFFCLALEDMFGLTLLRGFIWSDVSPSGRKRRTIRRRSRMNAAGRRPARARAGLLEPPRARVLLYESLNSNSLQTLYESLNSLREFHSRTRRLEPPRARVLLARRRVGPTRTPPTARADAGTADRATPIGVGSDRSSLETASDRSGPKRRNRNPGEEPPAPLGAKASQRACRMPNLEAET